MKHGKKVLALLVCVAMTAVLAVGCGGSGKSALDEIKEKGQLVWGTNAQFPPFVSKDGSGNVVGVDADIANAIGNKLIESTVSGTEVNAKFEELKSELIGLIG